MFVTINGIDMNIKLNLIPILLSWCVILMSTSKCDRDNLFYHTIENPVQCSINGIKYVSSPEKILNTSGDYHQFIEYNSGFYFKISRNIYSKNSSYVLYIYVNSEEPFELGKRYPVVVKNTTDFFGPSGLQTISDSSLMYYCSITGWVEFTDFSNDYHCYVSGNFEMDCIDNDDSPITVRNGHFGPVRVYYDDKRE